MRDARASRSATCWAARETAPHRRQRPHPRPPYRALHTQQSIGTENYITEVPETLTRPDLDTPDTCAAAAAATARAPHVPLFRGSAAPRRARRRRARRRSGVPRLTLPPAPPARMQHAVPL